jgi:hypothetical protein
LPPCVPMFPPKAGKPNKGEQMVRYYGYCSNVSRGRRKNSDQDALVPCILQPEESSKGYRKNWARLIQKIYEVDPLACPRCKDEMRIMAFIEGEEVVEKIRQADKSFRGVCLNAFQGFHPFERVTNLRHLHQLHPFASINIHIK